jgi:hypothetical protein
MSCRSLGPVGLEALAEAPRALRERDPLRRPAALQVGAVERLREAGPAHVDQHQVVGLEQVAEDLREGVGGPGARVSGATLDGEDRAPRSIAAVGRPHGEGDRGLAQLRLAALERDLDRAAAKAQLVEGPLARPEILGGERGHVVFGLGGLAAAVVRRAGVRPAVVGPAAGGQRREQRETERNPAGDPSSSHYRQPTHSG